MALQVVLTEPTYLGGSDTITLKAEKLTYGIHRDITVAKFANKDQTKTMDVQASLLDISITGILTSVGDVQALITAARTWWTGSADDTSDATLLPKVQWRSRSVQYMTIERLSITDLAETDSHEFEYTLELAVDTRTS